VFLFCEINVVEINSVNAMISVVFMVIVFLC